MLLPVSWYHLPEKSAGRCYPLPIMQPEEVRGLASDQYEEDNHPTDPKRCSRSEEGKMLYIIYILYI
jgi:hypothetical protein